MGVATLFPNKYALVDCQFIRPSTYTKKYFSLPSKKNTSWWSSWFGWFQAPKETCFWYDNISKKTNIMLVLILKVDFQDVAIVNYHSPCVYKCLKSMCIVTALAAKV